jgi:hypothetical protein
MWAYSYSPTADGRCIGEMIMEVAHTDIGLVRLQDDETFHNITFQNDDISDSIHLKRLSSAKDCRTGDYVFLDSPDTDCFEGHSNESPVTTTRAAVDIHNLGLHGTKLQRPSHWDV